MASCSTSPRLAGSPGPGAVLLRPGLAESDPAHGENHPGAAAAAHRHPGEVAPGAAAYLGDMGMGVEGMEGMEMRTWKNMEMGKHIVKIWL